MRINGTSEPLGVQRKEDLDAKLQNLPHSRLNT